jgi:hypothetical protein|tara:strand:- start:521 stop:1429 length:909 start_codon:yes stop_codon:yes gene_type:complete
MSRNNNDRLGGATPPDDTPTATVADPTTTTTANETQAPTLGQGSVGLNFVVPTEFVDLPSRGQFYAPSHPLHGQDTIEVRHMTAREEDILTSRTLLKKGIALDRLIESIVVNKSIKADTLLLGDKNSILVTSRIVAYGNEYNTKVTCPSCYAQVNFNFDLNNHQVRNSSDVDDLEFETTTNGTFKVTLPKTNVVAEFKVLTGADENWLARQTEKKKKMKNAVESTLSDQMRLFTVSLNGVTDKKTVNDFINHMPAADSRFLRTAYSKLSPNLDMTQDFSCYECGHEGELEVPFTAEFFWPKQ